ncbi:MAG: chloride channel protein, partial [Alphaproteobacteria bacterium]|nr:chloride channel protein [Alphaproteobacteria bacterium]
MRYWLRTAVRPSLKTFTDQFSGNLRSFLGDKQFSLWLLALALGPAIAYAAIGFRLLIGYFQLPWLFTTSERIVSAAHLVPWWLIVVAPTVGGLVVGYVLENYMAGKRGHSVADVIEAKALSDCRIDPKTGLLSALLATVSLGFGASAGREGPVVHLGATLASWIASKTQLPRSARRTLLAAGAAAAVSASFNAPIAGVLFAHEVILQHYALRAFIPIVIASVAAGVIARLHFGNFPAFIIPDFQIASYWEFPAFLILGMVCAVVAIL